MPAAAPVDGALLTGGGVDLIDGGLLELAEVAAEDLDRALVDGEDELAVRHPGGAAGVAGVKLAAHADLAGNAAVGRDGPDTAGLEAAQRGIAASVSFLAAFEGDLPAVRREVWVIIDEVVRRVGELLVQVAVGSGGKQRAVVVRGIGVAPEHDPAGRNRDGRIAGRRGSRGGGGGGLAAVVSAAPQQDSQAGCHEDRRDVSAHRRARSGDGLPASRASISREQPGGYLAVPMDARGRGDPLEQRLTRERSRWRLGGTARASATSRRPAAPVVRERGAAARTRDVRRRAAAPT